MTLAEAREAAREVLGALLEGKDPVEVTEARRREEARRRADTFDVVAQNFVDRLEAGKVQKVRGTGALRDASWLAGIIRREFLGQMLKGGAWVIGEGGLWRGRAITDITRRDVREAIEAVVLQRGRYAGRHAFAAARRLFGEAVDRDLVEKSPCEGLSAVKLHGAPTQRDRILSDDELRLVWRAAGNAGYPFGTLVQLLLLTGQRRDEIADAGWSEVTGWTNGEDGKAVFGEEPLLTIPAARMKGNFVQTVPLVPAAVEILETVPRFAGGDYILTMTAGRRPIAAFSKAKTRLDAAVLKLARENVPEPDKVSIAPWTLHDLRRTVRTGLSSVGVLPVIAELAIGHKQVGISAIYDRHRYDAEKRDALTRWEAKLLAIVRESEPEPTAPAESDNIVRPTSWRARS
jgi:integrase